MKYAIMSVVALVLVLVVSAVAVLGMYVSYSNREVRIRNQINAQKGNIEVIYDNTWKIIQQKAQVSGQYADKFKDIYVNIMDARYDNARGGALLSFITESNPNFDPSLYKELSVAIEAQRTKFTHEQTKILAMIQEHNNLLQTIPSSFFVGGRPAIEYNTITSSKTEAVVESGREDDVKLSF